jgi:uncharacterized ion transporter superfamily protein YfcC
MKKAQPVIIFILFVAFVVMYLHTPSGHKQEIDRLNREIKKREKALDSANIVIRDSRYREMALKARYSLQEQRTTKAIQEAEKNLKLYQNEKKRKTPILNDASYDSILSVLYPR